MKLWSIVAVASLSAVSARGKITSYLRGRQDTVHSDTDIPVSGLLEGDIVPHCGQIEGEYGQALAAKLREEGKCIGGATGRDLALVPFKDWLWQDRDQDVVVVPYQFDATFSGGDIAVIENALADLATTSGVVKFVPRSGQTEYIRVVGGPGCWSYVGKVMDSPAQDLSLGPGCIRKGVVQHEFLHALGMWHEQSRRNRDAYVRIQWENISPGYESNFEVRTNSMNLGSPYDYGSVLHYPANAFSANDEPTIVPIETTAEIGQRTEASPEDIVQLQLLYQCTTGPRSREDWENNLCTTDCKCWEGASGCGSNHHACQGELACEANQCVPRGTFCRAAA